MGEPADDTSPIDEPPRWDANDPRRQKDAFAPPTEPCECYCLHCGRVFMSDQIWLQRIIGGDDEMEGFWMCPTANCSGAGFTFDIFPTDPAHPANEGWHDDDDDEDDEEDDDPNREWDPEETKYKELDEVFGEEEDIDGEEWKFGLAAGERPPEPEWSQQARQEWEAEQKKYDEPDQRPREVDWSDRDQGPAGPADTDVPF